MVLATWWYEDGPSALELPADLNVESPIDDEAVIAVTGLTAGEVRRRRDAGHRPYITCVDGVAAAYGWVATQSCSIGELDLTFTLPAGNRYLWDFATLEAFRGRGVYPYMLAEIVRRECPPAVRLWIIHAPENLPSGVGIARAGFIPVAELSFSEDGRPALSGGDDVRRTNAATELLGLPIVASGLEDCWACGGSCNADAGEDGHCDCAIVPSRSATPNDVPLAATDGRGASTTEEPVAVARRSKVLWNRGAKRSGGAVAPRDDTSLDEARPTRPAPDAQIRPRPASFPVDSPETGPKHRIGPVVVASLFAGFLAAIFLVLVPFGGASENSVSGAALLGFSLGWASLGVLSVRLTDQPQRWATIAAFVTASTAAVLMVWGAVMTHAWFAWLWPPTAIAFAVWMAVQSLKAMHSPVGLTMLYGVFALVVLLALGGALETVSEARDRRDLPMPGQLVSVGDHRLHIFCSGEGGPTVVLEPGLGETSTEMSGWIAPAVSLHTRVCLYDRAGRGWSEAVTQPQDGREVAADLHTLLTNSGEHGPYILAGHSLGGAYVMNFAAMYPDDVAGVVLLDSMHPQQYDRLPGYPTFYQMFRRASGVLPSLSRVGLARLVASHSSGDLPATARDQERGFWSTPRQYRSLRDEFAELPRTLVEAGDLRTLGDKPLIVVTAGKDAQEGWQSLQDELATLSSNSIHRLLPDATHADLVENEQAAGASSQAILDVLAAVRSGQRLSTGDR